LDLNILQIIELIFISIPLICLLAFSYNNLSLYSYRSNLGLCLAPFVSLLENAIDYSQFNDIYLATLFIIGISMIFLNLLGFKKNTMSYQEVILILSKNKKDKSVTH
jgi:ABC-type spermidine/putrescine transport system permease subunit II